ncbi:hypothetical protein DFH07DRAFT_309651 [Mycena maculata]|uniref:Uncharacterized protein n=1 Tax=Mycena maculata TaxID=230809 RepID=A0AAD7MJ59_9AGAR|nr:hypothetical protein DFH07DRAFT_309651 [Mycena maculata]
MVRTTRFVFETTGGSPTFHIPFPLSSLTALAGVHPDGSTSELEDIELIFRNIGGTPTFHVGGAEIGVESGAAWDYNTVIGPVLQARLKAKGEQVSGFGEVRVKVEEEEARIPQNAKGKENDKTGSVNSQRGNLPTANQQPQNHSAPGVLIKQVSAASREHRSFSAEEASALARGTRLHVLDAVEARGRQDFALLCAPAQPAERRLTIEEQVEWNRIWQALLRLDRIFSGPLRDNDALRKRSEEMMADGARRVRDERKQQGNVQQPGKNPCGLGALTR